MSNLASASRTVVIRASRDTLSLVAAASAMTFALAYAIHTKHDRLIPAPLPALETRAPEPQQDWAGHLAELAPATAAAPSEPMSSAALVVPKAQLALPPLPKASTKSMRPCPPDASCVPIAKAPTSSPAAPPRRLVAAADKANAADKPGKTLVGMLNPLNHLPDMTAVGRPFASAGGAVAGWFKRL